ncbi:MAG: hypothetical protein WCF67_20030 [Chitinophagaceae bacterium]
MKLALFIVYLLLNTVTLYAQDDKKEDKEISDPKNKTDTTYFFEEGSTKKLKIYINIRIDEHKKKPSTTFYDSSKALLVTRVVATNSITKRKEFFLRLNYTTGGFPAERKEIYIDSSQVQIINNFFDLMNKDSGTQNIHYTVKEGLTFGKYYRSGKAVYFILVDGVEYYLYNKSEYLALQKCFHF